MNGFLQPVAPFQTHTWLNSISAFNPSPALFYFTRTSATCWRQSTASYEIDSITSDSQNLHLRSSVAQVLRANMSDEVRPAQELAKSLKTYLILDFDWTLIEENSDTFVIEQLGAEDVLVENRGLLSWNDLMNHAVKVLHARGVEREAIEKCLKEIPLLPEFASLCRDASSKFGSEAHIVSDANRVYIDTILSFHGLSDCFTSINTNPAHWEVDGSLSIKSYQLELNGGAHNCPNCPPNMCKGGIVGCILGSRGGSNDRVIYIGDGSGDFCPCLHLQSHDFVLARHGYPLIKKLEDNAAKVRAQVSAWAHASEVYRLVCEILAK